MPTQSEQRSTIERTIDGRDVRMVPFDDPTLAGGLPHKFNVGDTRHWLADVDRLGELRVLEGVDWERNIGRISEILHHDDAAPAVLFDEIPGFPRGFRVLVNTLSKRSRLAATLNLPPDIDTFSLMDEWERRLNETEPEPVRMVDSGPITENVMRGPEVDLMRFPTPQWHPEDGGRYIGTGCAVLTRDPESGWINTGTYRAMLHDDKRTGLYISPSKHGRAHMERYFERDQAMPVVILVGLAPLHFLAAALEIPDGVSELEWIGGIVGEPIECIEGELTGMPIPACAEIALEGHIRPGNTKEEGPFGEWTGYYASLSREEPVVDVEAVYYRNDPILLGCPPQKPPYEGQKFQQYMRSANLRREIRAAGVPNVEAAFTHSVGGCRLFNVVSIKQKYPGHAKQAALIASQCRQGAYLGRIVVVVDDDVDVTDLQEVIWVICTRHDPERDVEIIKRVTSGKLDPAIRPGEKGYNSRLIIDATRPFEWFDEFPAAIGPEPEEKWRAREDWDWILRTSV